jgi:hypothetical protein
MNDETGKISVIAARFPYTDRRALSEAWFSALHLASDGPLSPPPPERRAETDGGRIHPRGSAERAEHRRPEQRVPPGTGEDRAARAGAENGLRRPSAARAAAARAELARQRSYATFRTSFTLGVEGERVALALRRDGATLHVVALCRPAVEGIVRRALACAGLYLRARGESIDVSVATVGEGVAL